MIRGKFWEYEDGMLGFYCPGCKTMHPLFPKGKCKKHTGPKWDWNGSYEKPTASPSIMTKGFSQELGRKYSCHSFMRNGQLQFLSDCTHDLAGQTVDMLDLTEEMVWGKDDDESIEEAEG